jgi:DNA-binding IclR family transcriptional regulator
MAHNNRRLNINSSVIKAFTIIEYLASVQTAKDLGVISNELGLNKSTVYRFLTTLSQLGYITQEPTNGKYSLGSKVVWLASQFLDGLDLRTLAHPYLQQLSEETGETVHLAILDNYEVVYIDKIKGRQPVDMRSSVGK